MSAFINSGYFDLAGAVYAPQDAERLLDLNEARAVLVIPEGFGRDIRSRSTVPVQVIISGDNANTATTVLGYAGSILRTASAELAPGVARARRRRSPSSRASGTTRSCAARCFSCPG